jgi:peptidylprolyl isomerase
MLVMNLASINPAAAQNPENTIYMDMSTGGRVTIKLLPEIAPKHVNRIKKLAREGFYDGVVFHRVIPGFMAQTGDPGGTGTGGSEYPDLPAEFSDYEYQRGTVGMARTQDPNSANSQFFICFDDDGCDFLTGEYTVLGQVTDGMEYIDAVAVGEPPANPSKITGMKVAIDTAEGSKTESENAPGTGEQEQGSY